jgi:hypothetical protein
MMDSLLKVVLCSDQIHITSERAKDYTKDSDPKQCLKLGQKFAAVF